MTTKILEEIYSHKNKNRAKSSAWYFKTSKGQYGEGDIFWGLTVSMCRKIAEKYKNISKSKISLLLKNKVHEVRLVGVLVLVYKYKTGTEEEKKEITDFYLESTKYVNNWDLVDLSAYRILGDFLLKKKNKNILLKLARSKNLWDQRIAIISTFAFIKKGDLRWIFKLARMFLNHKHDLIHKATGWMLREAGKEDVVKLRKFLDSNLSKMPRTTLRYAIEKFPENIRKKYLRK